LKLQKERVKRMLKEEDITTTRRKKIKNIKDVQVEAIVKVIMIVIIQLQKKVMMMI
jgi:hypothetical protein